MTVGVVNAIIFLLVTIACFDYHWQYITCTLIGVSRTQLAYKHHGNEAYCTYVYVSGHNQSYGEHIVVHTTKRATYQDLKRNTGTDRLLCFATWRYANCPLILEAGDCCQGD